jgi:hypothetical protein
MAKGRKRKRDGVAWTGAEHAVRQELSLKKNSAAAKRDDAEEKNKKLLKKKQKQHERTAALTHDTFEKKQAAKLKLHLAKTRRNVKELRKRLTSWDPLEENKLFRQEESKEKEKPVKKKGRKGPETWKLRGAARPAQEVYDFDTRYVDPHAKAHRDATERARRSVNLLLCKHQWEEDEVAEAAVREYLMSLMQLGHLSQEAAQYNSAREAWLECIEIETDGGVGITNARECLIRMYMEVKRYDSILRFVEKDGKATLNDSVWIRYSAALAALASGRDDAETFVALAIQSNVFCAYYLSFHDTFSSVMEYTDELEESDEPQSSLEEAIEYCCSEHAQFWLDVEDAVGCLKRLLLQSRSGNGSALLSPSDVEWSQLLDKIVEARTSVLTVTGDAGGTLPTERKGETGESLGNDSTGDVHRPTVDIEMFAGMFRTAMEMLDDAGEL